MSKYKEGDRVLVEATVEGPEKPGLAGDLSGYPAPVRLVGGGASHSTRLHPMPPVPPEKLLEELELVDAILTPGEIIKYQGKRELEGIARYQQLRSQRLAASQPTYQEVLVRARLLDPETNKVQFRSTGCSGVPGVPDRDENGGKWSTFIDGVSPDDIIDPDNIVSEETDGIDYMAIRGEPAGATRDPHDPEPPTEET